MAIKPRPKHPSKHLARGTIAALYAKRWQIMIPRSEVNRLFQEKKIYIEKGNKHMAKSHSIKDAFEENLWILVKENANLASFRKLLELRINPDLLCQDRIERDSKLTVFDF